MITTTDYDNKHVFLREECKDIKGIPVRCNHLALMLITDGEVKIEINYSVFHAKKNSLIMALPLDIVTFRDFSYDYKSKTLVVPMSLITPSLNSFSADFDFYEKIKWNPVTPLYGKDLEIICKILDTIDAVHENFEYEEFEQSALAFVKVIFQFYRSYFKRHEGYAGNKRGYETRKKTLFRKFVKELVSSHNKSREVLFYANELGVSSGYLNEVCNEISNYSAKDIIDTAVSSRLKFELSYTDKSIQELADEYNFPSQSYLSRYYKRLTGLSPSEFRKQRKG